MAKNKTAKKTTVHVTAKTETKSFGSKKKGYLNIVDGEVQNVNAVYGDLTTEAKKNNARIAAMTAEDRNEYEASLLQSKQPEWKTKLETLIEAEVREINFELNPIADPKWSSYSLEEQFARIRHARELKA